MQPTRSPERSTGGRIRKTSIGKGSVVEGFSSKDTIRAGERQTSTSTARFASSSTGATSGISATRRAHHILGGEDRIILDVGARVTKAGHCGEVRPRCVQYSLRLATPKDQEDQDEDSGILFTLDESTYRSDAEERIKHYLLSNRIKLLLREVLYSHLVQDTKQRKIVVVENVFLPSIVKDAIREALFDNLQVANVSFAPASVMSAVAIGRSSVLNLDVGYEQSTLVPVHLWRPMMQRYVRTSTRAAQKLSLRLKALMIKFGTFIPPSSKEQASRDVTSSTFAYMQSLGANRTRRRKIPLDLLDEDVLDEIKAKCLITMDKSPEEESIGEERRKEENMRYPNDLEEFRDDDWMNKLERRYCVQCDVKDMVISVPSMSKPSLSPPSQPSTLGSTPESSSRARQGAIIVPGWIRAYAVEVLFEQGDWDSPSLTEMVLDCLLLLPIDLRFTMARNVYVTGGTAMIPGFAHRLRLELVRTLHLAASFTSLGEPSLLSLHMPKVGLYPNGRSPRRVDSAAQVKADQDTVAADVANEASIVDQSFVSAQGGNGDDDESFATTNENTKSTSPSNKVDSLGPNGYTHYTPIAGLVEHMAVINDHAPRLAEDGLPLCGHAPSFPVNIAAWIGASLTGSLRIDAVDQIQREQWIDQRERIKAQRLGRAGGTENERPSLGLGRGSFLGSVSGLDLGTYGPLSGGARNRFSSHAGAASSALRSPGASSSPRSPPPAQ